MKKLKEYTEEELEMMGYDDLAYLILEQKNKKMKINDLFKSVCQILKIDAERNIDKIADFFEILTTDKRFTLLKNGYWDLKQNHIEKVIIEDEEEEIEEMPEENLDDENEEKEKDFFDEETDDDTTEDDLKDLIIIDDEDESEM